MALTPAIRGAIASGVANMLYQYTRKNIDFQEALMTMGASAVFDQFIKPNEMYQQLVGKFDVLGQVLAVSAVQVAFDMIVEGKEFKFDPRRLAKTALIVAAAVEIDDYSQRLMA